MGFEKMKKSGGSGVQIRSVRCEIDAGTFVPMSRFNALRRKATEELREKIIAGYHRQSQE